MIRVRRIGHATFDDPRPWHAGRPQRPKVWSREDRSVAGWGPPPTPDYHLDRDE
jgi:hypothetical protein